MSFSIRAVTALVAVTAFVQVSAVAAQKRDPYTLLQAEIATHKDIRTAYEAVQQLRPRFLRGSRSYSPEGRLTSSDDKPQAGSDPGGGTKASDGILVVLNGARRGGVDELKAIPVEQVESIHFIKSEEALGVYGPDQSGVIEVKTVEAKSPGH